MEIQFETERLILKCLNESDAGILLDYFSRNAEFLQPWEVVERTIFYTMETWRS